MLVEHSEDSLFTTSAGIDKESEVRRIPYANKSNLIQVVKPVFGFKNYF